MPDNTRARQDYCRRLASPTLVGECLQRIDVFIDDPTRFGVGTVSVLRLEPLGQPHAFGKDDEHVFALAGAPACTGSASLGPTTVRRSSKLSLRDGLARAAGNPVRLPDQHDHTRSLYALVGNLARHASAQNLGA